MAKREEAAKKPAQIEEVEAVGADEPEQEQSAIKSALDDGNSPNVPREYSSTFLWVPRDAILDIRRGDFENWVFGRFSDRTEWIDKCRRMAEDAGVAPGAKLPEGRKYPPRLPVPGRYADPEGRWHDDIVWDTESKATYNDGKRTHYRERLGFNDKDGVFHKYPSNHMTRLRLIGPKAMRANSKTKDGKELYGATIWVDKRLICFTAKNSKYARVEMRSKPTDIYKATLEVGRDRKETVDLAFGDIERMFYTNAELREQIARKERRAGESPNFRPRDFGAAESVDGDSAKRPVGRPRKNF